jgi:hypothetical protein
MALNETFFSRGGAGKEKPLTLVQRERGTS